MWRHGEGGSYHTDLDVEQCQGCSWANWPPLRAFIRKVMKWMQRLSWISPRPLPQNTSSKLFCFCHFLPKLHHFYPTKCSFQELCFLKLKEKHVNRLEQNGGARLVNEFEALQSSFLCYQPSIIKAVTLLESAFCSFFEWSAYETSHYQIYVTWTAWGSARSPFTCCCRRSRALDSLTRISGKPHRTELDVLGSCWMLDSEGKNHEWRIIVVLLDTKFLVWKR